MKKKGSAFKKYFDSIWYSSLQAKLCVCSFVIGAVVTLVCLFCVLPVGEITQSAIQAVAMFLVLSGAAAGIKVAFDLQSQKFSAKINEVMNKINNKNKNSYEDEFESENNDDEDDSDKVKEED